MFRGRSISGLAVTLVFAAHALSAALGPAEVTGQESAGAESGAEQVEPAQELYAVLLAKGPAFVEGGDAQPGMEEHVVFIKALHAEGVAPLAGALFDDDEGARVSALLYFVRAGSLSEARAVVMAEPLVQRKVVVISSIRMFAAGVGRLD